MHRQNNDVSSFKPSADTRNVWYVGGYIFGAALFFATNNLYSFIAFGIVATLAILFAICFAIAWLMPKKLKQYLNRKYNQLEEKDLSEEELLDLIHTQLNRK